MKAYTGGYIKLYRELKKKAIWKTSTNEQKVILITLLLMVNWEEVEWEWKGEKYTCKPGQMITSIKKIIDECGGSVSRQNVRTALERFEKYDFLTKEVTNASHLITICNWEQYQDKKEAANQEGNQRVTNGQPTGNQRVTTNEEYKEDKEYKEINNNTVLLDEKKFVEGEKSETPEEEKLPTKRTPKKPDFINLIIEKFQEAYFEEFKMDYIPTAGDKKHIAWILTEVKKLKNKKGEAMNTEETLLWFQDYFSLVVKIKSDKYIRDNMGIPILKSKFNQINRILKSTSDGRNKNTENNPNEAEFRESFAKGVQRALKNQQRDNEHL